MLRAIHLRPAPLSLPMQAHQFVAVWVALNATLLLLPVTTALLAMPHDWMIWVQIPERVSTGRLYAAGDGYYFVFAPLTAWIMAVLIPLGYSLWWGLHLAMLPILRDWKLIALVVLSVPFWVDTMIGSTVVFVFVAGILALRGSRAGALVYLALFLLMPRPVHLPLAAWLVWQRPGLRWPFVGMVAALAFTTLASGSTADWVRNLVQTGQSQYDALHNFSPTRLVAGAWLLVGVPLAMWLTLKGRVGLAGLAMTPYLLPPYFLMLLWDRRDGRSVRAPSRIVGSVSETVRSLQPGSALRNADVVLKDRLAVVVARRLPISARAPHPSPIQMTAGTRVSRNSGGPRRAAPIPVAPQAMRSHWRNGPTS